MSTQTRVKLIFNNSNPAVTANYRLCGEELVSFESEEFAVRATAVCI